MSLLKKLRRNKETEQKVEEITETKKQTLTEKLGIPFGLNEIEYISIITTFEKNIFYLAVSNREDIKIMPNTYTNSKEEIVARLVELKSHFRPYGNYVDLGEGMPLVNLQRIKSTSLIWDENDENTKRNHAVVYLSHGQEFSTQPEISTAHALNKSEFIHNTFWAHHNDCMYGK